MHPQNGPWTTRWATFSLSSGSTLPSPHVLLKIFISHRFYSDQFPNAHEYGIIFYQDFRGLGDEKSRITQSGNRTNVFFGKTLELAVKRKGRRCETIYMVIGRYSSKSFPYIFSFSNYPIFFCARKRRTRYFSGVSRVANIRNYCVAIRRSNYANWGDMQAGFLGVK